MMKVWGKRVTSACPRWHTPIEGNTHIMACQTEVALIEWSESMVKIRE